MQVDRPPVLADEIANDPDAVSAFGEANGGTAIPPAIETVAASHRAHAATSLPARAGSSDRVSPRSSPLCAPSPCLGRRDRQGDARR